MDQFRQIILFYFNGICSIDSGGEIYHTHCIQMRSDALNVIRLLRLERTSISEFRYTLGRWVGSFSDVFRCDIKRLRR